MTKIKTSDVRMQRAPMLTSSSVNYYPGTGAEWEGGVRIKRCRAGTAGTKDLERDRAQSGRHQEEGKQKKVVIPAEHSTNVLFRFGLPEASRAIRSLLRSAR